jgi:DNA-binding CsgD family transcriptional regulator
LQVDHPAIAEALDRLSIGVVLVNNNAEVLYMNRAASNIVASGDALIVNRRRLEAVASGETSALRKLISQAGCSSHDGVRHAMLLSRRSSLRPLSVIVAPLRRSSAGRASRLPAALIFASDPEVNPEAPEELLIGLYGLTRTEAALAAELLQGRGLAWAAQQLSISINTARTHLKRVFQKTETNRQAELVQLILRCAGSIHGN